MRFLGRSRASSPRRGAEEMTLGELVSLVADDPTPAHRDAVFGRLLFAKVGVRHGGPARPGVAAASGEDRPGIPSTRDDDGNLYLVVLCDVPALAAAFPDDRFVELAARVVLETARDNGVGVIVRNDLDPSRPWLAVPKERVADILAGRYSAEVRIPPGHTVVTVESQPTASFRRLPSGIVVADLGNGDGLAAVVAEARRQFAADPDTRLVWLVQPLVLGSPAALDAVVEAIEANARVRGQAGWQTVVAPYASHRHVDALRRLRACRLAVHYGGPNGECFVEVHRPDGVTIGIPGPVFRG